MKDRNIIMTVTSVLCFITACYNPEHWFLIGIFFGCVSGYLQQVAAKGAK